MTETDEYGGLQEDRFGISLDDLMYCSCLSLSNMFDADHHSTGVGLKIYQDHGGKEGLLRALNTSEEGGLQTNNARDIEKRGEVYGTNDPKPVQIKSLWQLIKEQLNDQTLKILIVSCIASLVVGIWKDISAYINTGKIVSLLNNY
jgi:magnesium-transporting ATPase (P-type)